MKHIRLHGELAREFGAEWRLDVASPSEALRAIEANRPGLMKHLIESESRGVGYRVVVGERDVDVQDLQAPFSKEVLHVVPVMSGAKSGAGQVLLGGALLAASFFLPATALFTLGGASFSVASITANIGVGLLLGGVAQMLVGTPRAPTPDAVAAAEQKPSYFFNGPVNTSVQGSPVPVGYGLLIVGSQPISVGLAAENV